MQGSCQVDGGELQRLLRGKFKEKHLSESHSVYDELLRKVFSCGPTVHCVSLRVTETVTMDAFHLGDDNQEAYKKLEMKCGRTCSACDVCRQCDRIPLACVEYRNKIDPHILKL